jgi:hypothetical protein
VHTVKRHWDGILRWFDSKIANGLIEGINSLMQAEGQGARLSLDPRPQGHGLPGRRKARPQAACIRRFLPTLNSHAQQRGIWIMSLMIRRSSLRRAPA